MEKIQQAVELAAKERELLNQAEGMFSNTSVKVTMLAIMPLLLDKSEAKHSDPELYYGFRSRARDFVKTLREAADDLEKHLNMSGK